MSQHFQCDLERLKEGSIRNNLARRCAITLCWDHAGLSHNEIAALFRMPSSNSVAQTIRRTKLHEAQTLKVLKNQISHKSTADPFTAEIREFSFFNFDLHLGHLCLRRLVVLCGILK